MPAQERKKSDGVGEGGNIPSDDSQQLHKLKAIMKAIVLDYFHMSDF